MQFAGLSIAQVLALFGAAASLTTLLYLLRQRRRRVAVPFLALWDALLRDEQSTRLFQSLKRILSLLLALATVGLLALAVGDPRPSVDTPSQRHTLVLVDAGLTMQSRDVEPSRLQAAIELARGRLHGAARSHRMLLAQMDAATVPLSPLSGDPKALERALREIAPTPLTTDFERAYAFALDVLHGQPNAELVLITDGDATPDAETARALAEAGIERRVLHVGTTGPAADNVALTAFAARRYPLDRNRSELLLEIHNASEREKRAQLTLLGDGRAIDVQQIALSPRARTRKVYDDITGVDRTLEAVLEVEGGDALSVDNRGYAVMPDRAQVRVLCVTDGNRYLEAALLLDEYLEVDVEAPGTYRDASGYDVVIFDRFVPAAFPSIPALYLRPEPREGAAPLLPVVGELERPFMDRLQRKHPLLRFTALRDVNITRALQLELQPDDVAVAADARGPLIVAGRRADQPFVALAFDIRESDLPLRVAWPLFLLNAIDEFTAAAGDYVSGHEVGRRIALPVPSEAAATLVEPSGARHALLPEGGHAPAWTPRELGFHRVEHADGSTQFAVNLPADARVNLERAPGAAPGQAARVTADTPPAPARPAWMVLIFVALALLSIEWVTYHRRWTV